MSEIQNNVESVFAEYDFCGWRFCILKKKFRSLRKDANWPIYQIWRQKPPRTFKLFWSSKQS